MKLVWTRRALDELNAAFRHVAADSPAAAERLTHVIEQQSRILIDHPRIGRPGRVDGTREFVIADTRYILPYRVSERRVEILAVILTSRQWPNQF